MAPRVEDYRRKGEEWRGRVRATFTGSAPCDWCGATPTRRYPIVPAEYVKGEMTRKAHYADACFDHALKFRLEVPGGRSTADLVAMRKEREARIRADRRHEMRENQATLFDLPSVPRNPLTEG